MKRTLTVIAVCISGASLLTGVAFATPTELGDVPPTATPTMPTTVPSCPTNPCYAVSRTTGYQAKVGSDRGPMTVTGPGRIVAWSIDLGAPTAKQVTYFNANEGGASSAAIAVLAPGKSLSYTLVAQSPVEMLTPYFGETVQFALDSSIQVKKGDVIALTVPTWAPALALGFGNDTSWRASRGKTACGDTTTQTSQTSTGTSVQYYCLYRTARLTYSATFIPDPVPTVSNTTSTTTTSSGVTSTTSTSTSTSTPKTKTSTSSSKTSTSTSKTSTSTSRSRTTSSKSGTTGTSGVTRTVRTTRTVSLTG